LHEALKRNRVAEGKSIDTRLLALQSELEEEHRLSYFDSLIAASALALDGQVVSNDDSFDRVPELRRIAFSR